MAAQLGIPPVAWAASLLGGSQIDWFGPLPNADMIGQMGLARSSNLRMQLFNGWTVMAGTLILFSILAVVMFLGGLLSISDRRYRVGAPKRAARRLATSASGVA